MAAIWEAVSHWFLTGTVVNALGVIVGGGVGLLIGKGIKKELSDRLMGVLGLCTLLIGATGAVLPKTFEGDSVTYSQNIILIILCMVIGTVLGELIDLDRRVNRLGEWLQSKCKTGTDAPVAEGFVTASLLFCVGAMAIVGSIESGLTGDHATVFAKTLLDTVAAAVFAASLGAGVLLSAGMVFAYQGVITTVAYFAGNFLTNEMIAQMSFVGNLIIVGLALNMMGLTKFRVMNMVPAIFLPILLCLFM